MMQRPRTRPQRRLLRHPRRVDEFEAFSLHRSVDGHAQLISACAALREPDDGYASILPGYPHLRRQAVAIVPIRRQHRKPDHRLAAFAYDAEVQFFAGIATHEIAHLLRPELAVIRPFDPV